MASFNLNSRVKIVNPSPNVDFDYGPYETTTDANNNITANIRAIGKTVAIGTTGSIVEYWWKSGTASTDLIPKSPDLSNFVLKEDISTLQKEEFSYTSGSQSFVLSSTFSEVYSIDIQGGGTLKESQYTLTPPKTVTILDTLDPSDSVIILYSSAPVAVSSSYTKGEVDYLLTNKVNRSGDTMTGDLEVPNVDVLGTMSANGTKIDKYITYNRSWDGGINNLLTIKNTASGNPYSILEVQSNDADPLESTLALMLQPLGTSSAYRFIDLSILNYDDDPRAALVMQSRDTTLYPFRIAYDDGTGVYNQYQFNHDGAFQLLTESSNNQRIHLGHYGRIQDYIIDNDDEFVANRATSIFCNGYISDQTNNVVSKENLYALSSRIELNGGGDISFQSFEGEVSSFNTSEYSTNLKIFSRGAVTIGGVSDYGETLNINGNVLSTGYKVFDGTSAMFLKADGSIDANTYQTALTNPITGTGTTNYLSKYSSSTGLTNSNISDNGSVITLGSRTTISGTVSSNGFYVNGGTSTQFLKADGSVDSTIYQAKLSGGLNSIPKFNDYGNLVNSRIIDNGTKIIIGGVTTDTGYSNQIGGNLSVEGNVLSNSFVKSGGTSTQFLMADGSVSTSILPYRSFVATISQSGTSAPTFDDIMENSLGDTIDTSYLGIGAYQLTLNSSSIFLENKTTVLISNGGTVGFGIVVNGSRISDNTIQITMSNTSGGVNGNLTGGTIEIRVYN